MALDSQGNAALKVRKSDVPQVIPSTRDGMVVIQRGVIKITCHLMENGSILRKTFEFTGISADVPLNIKMLENFIECVLRGDARV
jgi:hypothetical protein